MIMRKKNRKNEQTVEIRQNGETVEIMVPNRETLMKYKMGDSNFRVCGWCVFGTGQQMVVPEVGECWLAGRCSLIPLPVDNKGLVPPVRILDENLSRNRLLKEYKKFNDIEKKAISDFEKRLGIIDNMLKTVENTGDEMPDDMDSVMWNTECLFVRALANKEFRSEVIRRTRSWMEEFENRIGIRNQYIRELKGKGRMKYIGDK
jgi:hypothetical protein